MAARSFSATLASNSGIAAGAAINWPGGIMQASIEGAIPQGAIQFQTANGTWVDVDGLVFTAQGALTADVAAGQVRINVTAGSAVYAYATRVIR